MSLKKNMLNLDILSAKSPAKASSDSPPRNLMSNFISQTGTDMRDRLKTVEADLARHKDAVEKGSVDVLIPIDLIDRPEFVMRSSNYFTTERFYEIKESIRNHSVQDPITVRPSQTEGRYILVKGDTRLTSHEQLLEETGDLQWSEIKARVEALSDENAILMMVIENRDREDVWPYDQAVFYKRVLTELFQGERKPVMELLNISEGWLSKNLAVSTIPVAMMDAYPLLYQSGVKAMYPLAKVLEKATEEQITQLLENKEEFTETTPAAQSRKIISFLMAKAPSPTVSPQQVLSSDGDVLAEVKHSKSQSILRLDTRDKEGFGLFVEERLADIYSEWKASQE